MSHLVIIIAIVSAFFISLSGASQNAEHPEVHDSAEHLVVQQPVQGERATTEAVSSETIRTEIVTSSYQDVLDPSRNTQEPLP